MSTLALSRAPSALVDYFFMPLLPNFNFRSTVLSIESSTSPSLAPTHGNSRQQDTFHFALAETLFFTAPLATSALSEIRSSLPALAHPLTRPSFAFRAHKGDLFDAKHERRGFKITKRDLAKRMPCKQSYAKGSQSKSCQLPVQC